MKKISTLVFGSKENMAVIFVRKRSAVMWGLCKFLRKPGCQFDACLTSVVQVGIKEREHNHYVEKCNNCGSCSRQKFCVRRVIDWIRVETEKNTLDVRVEEQMSNVLISVAFME